MKNMVFVLLILGAFAAVPNVLWLMFSTIRVTNESGVRLGNLVLQVDSQSTPVGNIESESSRFTFLPMGFGEATLSLEYKVNAKPVSHCQEYVEGSGYHVEVVVDKEQSVRCTAELSIFSSLLVQKLF